MHLTILVRLDGGQVHQAYNSLTFFDMVSQHQGYSPFGQPGGNLPNLNQIVVFKVFSSDGGYSPREGKKNRIETYLVGPRGA